MARKGGQERGIFLWPIGKDGKQFFGIRYADEHGRERKEKTSESKKAAMKAYHARKVEVDQRRAQLADEKAAPAGTRLTLSQVMRRYRAGAGAGKHSWKEDRNHELVWLRGLGDPLLASIKPAQVEGCRNAWIAEGLSRSTVNHRLSFLRRIFNVAIRDGDAAENPVTRVKFLKEDGARVRYLTDEEEMRLAEVFPAVWWYVVEFALLTGLRQAEQFFLRWAQVDFVAGVLTIPRSKSGETRHVPMHPRVKEILQSLPSRLRSEWVFVGPKGRRLDPHNFCEDHFVPALERAGIVTPRPRPGRRKKGEVRSAQVLTTPRQRREFCWHDLRHTTASRLVMAGRELYDVQRLLGHKDYKMTLRYAHLSPKHLRDAINVLQVQRVDLAVNRKTESEKPEPAFA